MSHSLLNVQFYYNTSDHVSAPVGQIVFLCI